MTKPKLHHFVPEMLSSRFANANGKVFFFDQQQPEREFRETTPANLLAETHLYSTMSRDGEWDASLEALYSKLESAAAPVLDKLCDAGRKRRAPYLTSQEKSVWDEFIYNQWRRVPEAHGRYTNPQAFAPLLDESIKELETFRPLTPEERQYFNDPETRERLRRNARVGALSSASEKVLNALGNRGVMILNPMHNRNAFITGSFPVVKFTRPEVTRLTDPRVELWLAIASDVAVGISPEFGGNESVHGLSPLGVRRLNRAVASQGRFIVARDRALLASLVNPR